MKQTKIPQYKQYDKRQFNMHNNWERSSKGSIYEDCPEILHVCNISRRIKERYFTPYRYILSKL